MNEIYTGIAHYGKVRMINGKRVKQNRQEWIKIEVPQLAMIDRETYEAAQERCKRNMELYAGIKNIPTS